MENDVLEIERHVQELIDMGLDEACPPWNVSPTLNPDLFVRKKESEKRQVPKDQSIFLVLENKAQHQICPEHQSKEGKRRDKYSIRESEGEKIVQKDEETDKDGKTAEREETTNSCSEGVRRRTQIEG